VPFIARPSVIARFPRWMKVVPESLTILIHSLPVRQQIDSQVAEQLIVEFYSKINAGSARGQ
jgi:ribosomal protein S4